MQNYLDDLKIFLELILLHILFVFHMQLIHENILYKCVNLITLIPNFTGKSFNSTLQNMKNFDSTGAKSSVARRLNIGLRQFDCTSFL